MPKGLIETACSNQKFKLYVLALTYLNQSQNIVLNASYFIVRDFAYL